MNMNWIEEIVHDISSIASSDKDLRKFGVTVGGVILFITAFAYWKTWWSLGVMLAAALFGLILIIAGFFIPKSLIWINKIWMSIAIILGSVVSRIVLSILFFVILTPLAFIARLSHKKFFVPYKDVRHATYWVRREKNKKMNYEQMF
jgi:hypothetical protein